MKPYLEKFKKFLVDSNLVSTKNLELAEAEEIQTGRKLENVLIRRNFVSQEMIAKSQAYVLDIPFIDLTNEVVLPEVLKKVPELISRRYNVVAFRQSGENLEVAMLHSGNEQVLDLIKNKTSLNILPRLTSVKSLEAVLKQYQKVLEKEFSEAKEIKQTGSLTTNYIAETLFKHAILENASDVHIEPKGENAVVCYRKNGSLKDFVVLSKDVYQNILDHVKFSANLKSNGYGLFQNGRFGMEDNGYKNSMCVSISPVSEGEKISVRILHEDSQGFTLESLGLRGEALEVVHKAINYSPSMVLVTGAGGSGKTTTLYAILDILNNPTVSISTIENPIEYRIPRINQIQIGSDGYSSFAEGLKKIIHRDSDVVMLSEMKDIETASLAINTSLAGHLVLSSLCANSAASAVGQLIGTRAEPFLISSALTAVISQKLVRQLCLNSSEKYNLRKSEVEALSKRIDLEKILSVLKREKVVSEKDTWETIDFYKRTESQGCPSGFKGKIGIFEVLNITPKIKEMIIALASSDEIQKQAKADGMVTMLEDGFIKAAQGVTSLEEVLKVLCL